MKRKPVLCALLAVALLIGLASCGAIKSLWRADYDFFWDTVEENYPYVAAMERINGKSLAEVREKHTPAADAAQSAEELHTVLQDCMAEFPELVGHFDIMGAYMYGIYMDNIAFGGGGEKYAYMEKSLDTPQARAFYDYKNPTTEGEGEGEDGEPHKITGNVNMRYIPTPTGPSPYVAYVSINSMLGDRQSADGDRWETFWARIESKGYRDCIIDIRSNGGGADGYWMENIVVPNLSGAAESKHIALVRGKKSVSYLKPLFDGLIPIEKLDTKDLSALNPDDLAQATHYVEMDMSMTRTGEDKAYTGRIWLLVDEYVYSSSEKFAIFCKDTGFATIVGRPTGGDGIGIDPLAFALPNFGIAFRFSAMQGLNTDGGCNEELGTTPDVLCRGNEDALELCLEIIKERGGETP